jgi:hypothetical protein
MLQQEGRSHIVAPLTPVYKDAFRLGGLVTRFSRNEAGKATSFTVSLPRLRNLRFTRD